MRFRQVALPLLFVTLALTMPMPINAEVGMGVSDYNAKPEIPRGETERFPVARIYNTGNETFTASITARLDSNNSGIRLTVDPAEVTLKPDETCLVYLTADCTKAAPGAYRFTVEIQPVTDGNNMVLPAAVVDGEVIVTDEAAASNDYSPSSQAQDFSGVLLLVGVGSGLTLTYVVAKRRRMKRNEMR